MYSYLRGAYRGQPAPGGGSVLLEVSGVGYEISVPPLVEQELVATCQIDDPVLLYVSAQSGRDQPWPQLFGFLQPRQREFWELLKSVPRVGGKGAAKAMAIPIHDIARAIQEGNKGFLDGLPGVTLDGAEKMIASLRKKVGPFVQAEGERAPRPGRGPRSPADELREDAMEVLVAMGIKRPEAQRGVDGLLDAREDLVTVQDVVTAYLRTHGGSRP